MLLGKKASLFADISTKSSGTTWYSDDDAEYSRLSEAPKEDVNNLSVALNDAVSSVENYVEKCKISPDVAELAEGYKLKIDILADAVQQYGNVSDNRNNENWKISYE